MMMAKSMMTIKCTSSASHWNGHGGLPVQYEVHCPMQHDQGYSRSHWMTQLGNYSLSIAPAAARATATKHQQKHAPTLLAISMAVAVGWYDSTYIAQWRRSRASLEATGRHHWASNKSNNLQGTYLCQFY
jgi:hypothetical protein